MTEHWFWLLLTLACVAWYLTVTIVVMVRGIGEVKSMLARLKQNEPDRTPRKHD